MTYLEVLERVKKINSELVDKGFDSVEIENFWKEVFEACDKQIKLF